MAFIIGTTTLLIIAFIIAFMEGYIFSLPIRIPFIKRLAINHRTFRWAAIILLGIVPTVVNIVGIIWLGNSGNISDAATSANACNVASQVYCNSEEAGFEHVFNLDYSLKDELVLEVTLRDLAAGNTCVSDNAAVCAAADYWVVREAAEQDAAESDEYFTAVDALVVYFFLTLILSPSFLTGFDVYRLTRDTRKSKFVA